MKPKIVQITALDSTMRNLIGHLNMKSLEAGYEVHCICTPGEDVQLLLDKGYIVHPVKIDREISPLNNFRSIIKIVKILKMIKPEIVHVHTPIAAVLGRIAAKLAGVKNIIYTAHGFYFHDGMPEKKYKFFYSIEKMVGTLCTDYIFTQSKEDYDLAKSNNFLMKKKRNNYLHISNGIDIKNRFNIANFDDGIKTEIINKLSISEESFVITFIGRMVKEKGILDLVEAIEIIPRKYKIDLIAIGNVSSSERDQSLTDIIDSKSLKNIHFIGRVSNVEDYLFASDTFVLPSYREGMPRSIIEAMSLKNAVVATDIRGSREEVIEGYNGFLVDTNKPTQIAEKLIKLMDDSKLLKNMQDSGLKEVNLNYDEDIVVQKQINIFNKITK